MTVVNRRETGLQIKSNTSLQVYTDIDVTMLLDFTQSGQAEFCLRLQWLIGHNMSKEYLRLTRLLSDS